MYFYIALGTVLVVLPGVWSGSCGQYGRDWTIPGHVPTDLCCDAKCPIKGPIHDQLDETRCCCCRNTPRSLGKYLYSLYLEYTTVRGSSVLFSTLSADTKDYQVTHANGYLTQLPDNICDFDGIVNLNLDDNKIEAIQNLNCLKRLDTISMVRNRITIVTNDTFIGMSFLRILDLSGNRIRVLDAGTFSDKSLAVQQINFANNELQELDITNGIVDKPFCEFDYSKNKIETVTNKLGFKFEADKTYGSGGMVLLKDNLLTNFIDFTKIGLDDLTLLGKVMTYGFDLTGTKIKCDCTIEPFLELSYDVVKLLWRDYFDVKCYEPPSLHDMSIVELINASRFDLFICNLTDDCPPHCHCTAKPYLNITEVNCSSAGLTKLPLTMPDADNLAIDLSGNNIKRLEHRDYLNRTISLDVSHNSIDNIDTQALDAMRYIDLLNLTGNRQLESIPENMTQIQTCAIDFTDVYLDCDCTNTWIGEWFVLFNSDNCGYKVNQPVCKTSKGNKKAAEVTSDFLKCEESDLKTLTIILAICVSICIGLATFIHYYRYELVIIFRNLRYSLTNQSVKPMKPFDVYISSQDPSDDLRSWISSYLVSYLERSGYRVCLPYRDFEAGKVQSEEIIKMINMSKNVIIMASEIYLNEEDPWSEIEWSHAYRRYKSREVDNIIIINYDHMTTSDVTDRRMKAFFRLGMPLDFSNHDHSLVTNIKHILGHKAKKDAAGLKTAKPKFDSTFLRTKFNLGEETIGGDSWLNTSKSKLDTLSVFTNSGLNATKPKFDTLSFLSNSGVNAAKPKL